MNKLFSAESGRNQQEKSEDEIMITDRMESFTSVHDGIQGKDKPERQ